MGKCRFWHAVWPHAMEETHLARFCLVFICQSIRFGKKETAGTVGHLLAGLVCGAESLHTKPPHRLALQRWAQVHTPIRQLEQGTLCVCRGAREILILSPVNAWLYSSFLHFFFSSFFLIYIQLFWSRVYVLC